MNRTERIYRIDHLLSARGMMSRQALLDELQISWATLKRDMAYMKDHFNAPIIFDVKRQLLWPVDDNYFGRLNQLD